MDYLDYDKKGWSNTSGYGNIVNTYIDKSIYADSKIVPWNRIEPLTISHNISNTEYAWSPPMNKKNKKELYETCMNCKCCLCKQKKEFKR